MGLGLKFNAEKTSITGSKNHKASKEIVQKTFYDAAYGFKYSGEMTCISYITNVIDKDCGSIDKTSVFLTLQRMINKALRQLLPILEENLYIINLIAIYYRNGEGDEIN